MLFRSSARTLLKKGDFPYTKEKRYQDALQFAPNVVVIMLGTNDTKPQNWKHEADFEADYKDLVKSFQKLSSKPKVFLCRPVPVPGTGNYGINEADNEAAGPKASGFVVRELSPVVSNWRSTISLDQYLARHGIPGISEIDTRALTKKLRVDGAMKCCLSTLPISDEDAIKRARSWRDMAGADYVKDVTCREPFIWRADAPENQIGRAHV